MGASVSHRRQGLREANRQVHLREQVMAEIRFPYRVRGDDLKVVLVGTPLEAHEFSWPATILHDGKNWQFHCQLPVPDGLPTPNHVIGAANYRVHPGATDCK